MKKHFRKHLIFLGFLFMLLIICGLKITVSDDDHCKKLSKCLYETKLDIFELDNVTNSDSILTFSFSIKENKKANYYYDHYEDSGIIEINHVLNIINTYLNDNGIDEKICCVFHLTPGDGMTIYNYDHKKEETDIIYDNFRYFKCIYVENFSILKYFQQPVEIQIFADKIDSLDFVNTWTELEYLELNTTNISEEQIHKLYNLLPNCDININPI